MPARSIAATCGASGDVLLLDINAGDGNTVAVAAILDELGYATTILTSLPTDLSTFDQVWAFTLSTGYSPSIQSALTSYMAGGGALLANGEWDCCRYANETLEAMMDVVLTTDVTLLSERHDLGVSKDFSFDSSTIDGIGTIPNEQPVMTVIAYGEQLGVPPQNVLLHNESIVLASVWAESDMQSGAGRLVTIMDSNWSGASPYDRPIAPSTENIMAIANIAAFLGR
jgi:hypothetical protein